TNELSTSSTDSYKCFMSRSVATSNMEKFSPLSSNRSKISCMIAL
ncbi:7897_t:CDS:1, partial [Cetraspora pellucida]